MHDFGPLNKLETGYIHYCYLLTHEHVSRSPVYGWFAYRDEMIFWNNIKYPFG